MSVEYRWNDADREKLKYLEKNLSQCYFDHHKSSVDWPGIIPWTSAVRSD